MTRTIHFMYFADSNLRDAERCLRSEDLRDVCPASSTLRVAAAAFLSDISDRSRIEAATASSRASRGVINSTLAPPGAEAGGEIAFGSVS